MKLTRLLLALILLFASVQHSGAQLNQPRNTFTRADTLRGMLTPLRTAYDINYYHLDIRLDMDRKFISGSNEFRFTATQDLKRLQFDLFENMKIRRVVYQGKNLPFKREFNAVFIDFPVTIKKGSRQRFTVYYEGHPTIARQAPWDGGFVFSKDAAGKPWVGVAVQGFGASSWWPTKDHQADEVDSMLISVTVPKGLMDVSNGRLRSAEPMPGNQTRYNWFVSYPINNYNVTVNVADYAHFSDSSFVGARGRLSLDYFVLRENVEKARAQFSADVRPMLKCFEDWFGPYPFYRDGFKLIETPYLGMEHQSAVAYGNQYKKGYLGKDLSGTGLGMDWDYIIVHESGHEWFGNNITSKDLADMWIHEAFTMYSEGLFIECSKGKEAGARYIAGLRQSIENKSPIIGPYNVNKEGSGDMYNKGANMLQTIRAVIGNDQKWKQILRGLNSEFGLKTTTTAQVVDFFNKETGLDLTGIFDQYLKYPVIPVLELQDRGDGTTAYRWKADVKNFRMPVRVRTEQSGEWKVIEAGTDWKTMPGTAETIEADTLNYYIEISRN